jgi:hypothetical protein
MSSRVTLHNLPGYGKQLRQRLKTAGLTQLELADAASISRQTLHRAITRDEVSTKTAERIDAVLKGRAKERGAPASRVWANATDLVEWSKRRDAQEDLPRIVRRLIDVTVDGVRRMSFRAGEGIQLGGWDGRLLVDAGNAFVPPGESVWEMGTTANSTIKADEDYAKRTKSPGPDVDPSKTTFVFVTSRRFAHKDEWSAARRRERRWKDVRVIDADDLETWLESAPSVHLWLSARIGVFPDSGAQDMENWFNNWSRATQPRLTPAFLLAGREKKVEEIAKWRGASALTEPLEISSESRTESVAVFAATLDDEAIARAVVVKEESAWRRLIATRMPLILIALFDAGDETMAGVRAGHAIVVPLGEGDVARRDAILLPPVAVGAASEALLTELQTVENEKATSRARDRADEWARLARRSMTALRRRIARSSTLRTPEWATPAIARTILPALFAGSWSDKSDGDREFLEKIAMKPYAQVVDDLEKWAHAADPAIRHRGTDWYLVSREDAWELLGKYILRDDWERFYDASLAVLCTPDPRYELPLDQQWMAGVIGKKAAYSHSLRSGIAAFLALVFAEQSARIVRDLLRRANSDWKIWASLSSELSDLAEAAPDEFLSALDAGLRDPGAPIARLFTDSKISGGGALFSSSPHTGLLWALERLAWAPQYLARVTEVLGELAKRDPGGQLTNRPSASLQAVFRVMFPQTMASLAQRFRVLDRLAERDPQRAWDVLRSSLPRFHGSYMFSVRPKWRDWADDYDPDRRITRAEYDEAVTGTLDRLMQLAKRDGTRWASLIEALPQLDSAQHERIVMALRTLDADELDEADRSAIWEGLRRVAGQFRAFPDARWTMPAQAISAIDELRARFTPTDPGTRYGWLFGWRADLPDATASRKDYDAYHKEVHERRLTAVRQVFQESGLPGLFELSKKAERADFVGDAVGEAALLAPPVEDDLLLAELGGERHRDLFTRGYAQNRQRLDLSWAVSKVTSVGKRLRPEQLAALMGVLPSDRKTWALVASLGSDVERKYWESQQFLNNDEDLELAVEKLLRFGQVSTAIYFMGAYAAARNVVVRSELALDALERFAKGEGNVKPQSSDFGSDLAELLSHLSEDAAVDHQRLAQLEWVFLPILDGRDRNPKMLHTALAETPSFFVELITAVFRGDGDPKKPESEISEEDRERASRAYQLLQSWRAVPPSLRDWVLEARRLLSDARRLGIGDEQIGQVLSGAPSDPDGTWPPRVVRNLIEEIRSDDLENGIIVGRYNSRGVTSRAIGEGGTQERAIAEQYEGLATAVEDTAHRTAGMLRKIAKSYRAEAAHEDLSSSIEADIGS